MIVNSFEEYYEKIDLNDYDKPKLDNMEKITLTNKYNYAICTDGNDVDGMTGGVIWQLTLSSLKLKSKIFYPKRYEGYGINKNIIDQLIEEGFTCIITNDNGISAYDAIAYAKMKNLYVIITDHHLPKDTLPNADIIINPHIGNEHLLTHDICGAFVSYIICSQFYSNESIKELAALATVADMMPIIYYNKTIVKYLYKKIKTKELSLYSLNYMFNMNELFENFNDDTLSFNVIPIFNSYSRITNTCDKVIQFLLSEDIFEVGMLLNELKEINESCKTIKNNHYNRIIKQINDDDEINILYDNSIPSGLSGLIANKILEKTKKTTFVINEKSGSGRGPNALTILKNNKELFNEFGGHKEACGFSLKKDELIINKINIMEKNYSKTMEDKMNNIFNILIDDHLYEAEKKTKEKYIKFNYDNIEYLYEVEMEKLRPFGKGFEKPLFYSNIDVLEIIHLKESHSKIITDKMNFIYFNELISLNTKKLNVIFNLSKNRFQGKVEYQGIIVKINYCC